VAICTGRFLGLPRNGLWLSAAVLFVGGMGQGAWRVTWGENSRRPWAFAELISRPGNDGEGQVLREADAQILAWTR